MNESIEPRDAGSRIEDAPTLIASLAAGGVIGDRYEIAHLIARGGFGEVYRARDTLLERECAIKILASGAAGGGDELLQEARTAARLDHPNIVPVYDVGRADGRLWIAMRLIHGGPLSRALAPGESVPLARIVSILGQGADAIAHAHRKGIIHRDVKPQNLLLETREGRDHVWLTDFGIATVLAGATGMQTLAGTPGYMAPEQISGRRVDARTDIFALGCIAYELFTGARAFRADSYSELVYKVVHTDPPDFGEARRRFGAEAEAFLRKTLAKSPDDRFSTMEEAACSASTHRRSTRLCQSPLISKTGRSLDTSRPATTAAVPGFASFPMAHGSISSGTSRWRPKRALRASRDLHQPASTRWSRRAPTGKRAKCGSATIVERRERPPPVSRSGSGGAWPTHRDNQEGPGEKTISASRKRPFFRPGV